VEPGAVTIPRSVCALLFSANCLSRVDRWECNNIFAMSRRVILRRIRRQAPCRNVYSGNSIRSWGCRLGKTEMSGIQENASVCTFGSFSCCFRQFCSAVATASIQMVVGYPFRGVPRAITITRPPGGTPCWLNRSHHQRIRRRRVWARNRQHRERLRNSSRNPKKSKFSKHRQRTRRTHVARDPNAPSSTGDREKWIRMRLRTSSTRPEPKIVDSYS